VCERSRAWAVGVEELSELRAPGEAPENRADRGAHQDGWWFTMFATLLIIRLYHGVQSQLL